MNLFQPSLSFSSSDTFNDPSSYVYNTPSVKYDVTPFQAFKLYLASLEETIRHNPDSHFYIFLPSPEYLWVGNGGLHPSLCQPTPINNFSSIPLFSASCAMLNEPAFLKLSDHVQRTSLLTQEFQQLISTIRYTTDNVSLVDISPYVCFDNTCSTHISTNSASTPLLQIYQDDDHLNIQGSLLLEPMLQNLFN